MSSSSKQNQTKVWMDGCFDMVHFGHANAMRQAKQMGDYLCVGVHCDAEIEQHKGPPVFSEEERYRMVRSIKWVDEVIEGAPYTTSVETLKNYNCDFCAHGDDITTLSDGTNSYQQVIDAGMYKEFRRTEGISTTDLVGRMLLVTRQHHERDEDKVPERQKVQDIGQGVRITQMTDGSKDFAGKSPYTGTCHFVPTTKRIAQFSEGREPNPGDRIVYVAGAFDLFHIGHVDFLERAAKEGDFLIVGVHTDPVVNRYRGANYPIMNLHERVLSILSNRHVSEVVMGAPYTVTEQLMKHFRIDVVVHGRTEVFPDADGTDPYEVPKKLGKFKVIDSENAMSAEDIVQRIIKNRLEYEARNKKKEQKELRILKEMEQQENGSS